jgi:hypothetical protein
MYACTHCAHLNVGIGGWLPFVTDSDVVNCDCTAAAAATALLALLYVLLINNLTNIVVYVDAT